MRLNVVCVEQRLLPPCLLGINRVISSRGVLVQLILMFEGRGGCNETPAFDRRI